MFYDLVSGLRTCLQNCLSLMKHVQCSVYMISIDFIYCTCTRYYIFMKISKPKVTQPGIAPPDMLGNASLRGALAVGSAVAVASLAPKMPKARGSAKKGSSLCSLFLCVSVFFLYPSFPEV